MPSCNRVEWFCDQLDSSDCARVKRQYLQWHAEEHGLAFTQADPLFVAPLQESSSSLSWTLAEALWRARFISLDDRTLWECLGPDMVAKRVCSFIDPWNEQLAIKLAYYFLRSQSSFEESKKNEAWVKLHAELDAYAAATIKPQGTATVQDYIPLTTLARTDLNEDKDDQNKSSEVPAEWSDKVAFIPMEANNDFSEGSLRCIAPVPSCGVLLQVPRTEMFFRDTIVEHCALGRVIAAAPALRELLANEEALLVMCLVYERFIVGEAYSHWRQLLAQCPLRYPTIPTTWTLNDLAELEGLDMLDDVLTKRTQLQAVAQQLETSLIPIFHELLSPAGATDTVPTLSALLDAFAWNHLAWAQSTFDSRAFNLNVDGVVVMALVPLADMINHSNRTDVLIRKVEPHNGPFTMQVGAALTPADVGRELWMSYGPLQNWELLQHYGFVLGCENALDKLPFPLSLPNSTTANSGKTEENADEEEDKVPDGDDWDARRRTLLRRYALCLPGRCWIGYDGVPSPALLAILRVLHAQGAEFDAMEASRYGPFNALSAETEAAVVATVRKTVQCMLDVFPTTLSDDEETLAELRKAPHNTAVTAEEAGGGDDDHHHHQEEEEEEDNDEESVYNLTLCVQLRIGLKRIASRTLDWCSQRQ